MKTNQLNHKLLNLRETHQKAIMGKDTLWSYEMTKLFINKSAQNV